jgi:hypothetical protein
MSSMHPRDLPPNCSVCGAKLSFLLTIADTLVYWCAQDGLLERTPAGIIRRARPEELQARIDGGDLIG